MHKKPIVTVLATVVLTAAAVLSVAVTAAFAAPKAESNAQASKATNSAYIVQLAEQPVTAYTGGIQGYAATRPPRGQKINPNSARVASYKSYLESRQDAVLAQVGGGKKLYNYGYVFNGFAAELTPQQAQELASANGVLAVTRDEARALDTTTTPDFIGLTAPGGAWSEVKGENVIIGIVDGGIWPEHPSFSDRTGTNGNASKQGKLDYYQIPGWHGKCTPGEAFVASDCNQKLIGARYYNSGWGGNAGIDAQLPWEYNSPRDYGGHGTHTASTAGGNENVPITGAAEAFGSINGIAPRARIAAYKVCWETGSGGSCYPSDSVAAIDQAVADGVDVINFSISGSRTNFRDAVEIAFLYAADAGVFVATSAGNSGPYSSTVAHPGPWLTTVAASTHDRNFDAALTLGSGAAYSGASINQTPLELTPMVYAADVMVAGGNLTAARLCYSSLDGGNSLDPARVAGKIVVCDRGNTALPNKSLAVKEAGGVGMVLANTSPNSLNAQVHSVPSVHVDEVVRVALLDYIAVDPSSARAQIGAAYSAPLPAPFTAGFSSRGPLLAGGGDLLKPDVIAPGVDILAAVAPPGNGGESFASYQGTSMSSPHVAGLGALMKEKYPDWSPMAIKSALMTTGTDVLDGGTPAPNTNPVLIFRQGAGHVQPNSAMYPGVVYDSGFNDWLNFICGVQPGSFCSAFNAIDPSDLNQASIAIGDMAGLQTVKRSLTNVSDTELTLYSSIDGLSDIEWTVVPEVLVIAPGQTAEFEVTFKTAGAVLNSYKGGQLTWTGGGYVVRSPILIRPVALAAPAEVVVAEGGTSFPVTFGFEGAFSATGRGLVPAAVTDGSVDQDPDQTFDPGDPAGTVAVLVNVPAGTTYARFATFDADVAAGSDVDLFVFGPFGNFVGQSAAGGSDETVSLSGPAPGTYTAYVHGWGLPTGTSPFKLYAWVLDSSAAGNMTVTAEPANATVGDTGTITLEFTGLTPATRYLGSVAYSGSTSLPPPTIVRVDTP